MLTSASNGFSFIPYIVLRIFWVFDCLYVNSGYSMEIFEMQHYILVTAVNQVMRPATCIFHTQV